MIGKKNKGNNRGRKGKYDEYVKPRFNDIAEAAKMGATDKEIAQMLDIHKATFCEYKTKHPELNELLIKNRQTAVFELKAALFKRAKGYTNSEKTIVIDPDGGVTEKIVEKHYPADPACCMILLKHWDKDSDGRSKWCNDPATLHLKEKELELKKKQIEQNEW